jgi:uncharacterized repeat protein (TIGR01451 family)/LPXTG-motif cell wall-anchored protein
LSVTNNGGSTATNVVVTDTLPAGLQFTSSNPGAPTCQNVHDALLGTDTVTCSLGSLSAGASTSVTIVATGLVAGTLTNVAVVGPTDLTPIDNTSSVQTVVTPVADLEITKTVSPAVVNVGQNFTYTINVTNHGPSDATGVVVTDTLPADVTFVSASSSCTGTTTITCTIGNLAAGATASITIVARADKAGTVGNAAAVTSTTADPDLSNNQAQVDSEAVAPPTPEPSPSDSVLGKKIDNAQPAPNAPRVLGKHDTLPFTGADSVLWIALSGMLMLAGAGVILITRRSDGHLAKK